MLHVLVVELRMLLGAYVGGLALLPPGLKPVTSILVSAETPRRDFESALREDTRDSQILLFIMCDEGRRDRLW